MSQIQNSKFRDLILTWGFALLVCFYYGFLSYPNSVTGLYSDSTVYLFMADYFLVSNPTAMTAIIAKSSFFPPLFPLVLGLFGGGVDGVVQAHWVTTGTLLFCIGIFHYWLRLQGLPQASTWLLTIIFSTLPGVFLHSLFIASDFLFLSLLISVFVLAEKADSCSYRSLISVGLVIGLSILSRSAGIVLLPAFAVFVFHRQIPRKIVVIFSSLALPAFWTAYKAFAGFKASYGSSIFDYWADNGLAEIFYDYSVQSVRLAGNFVDIFDLTAGPASYVVMAVISVPFLLGLAYRLRGLHLDSLFLLGYLALILVWPFPHEAERFMLVVVPFFLFYVALGARWLSRRFKISPGWLSAGFCVLMLAVSLPSFARLTGFMFSSPDPEILAYTRNPYWFKHDNIEKANEYAIGLRQVFEASRAIADYVPENQCVYATYVALVVINSKRVAVEPPINEEDVYHPDVSFDTCDYFFMIPSSPEQKNFPSMYPDQLIKDQVETLFVSKSLSPDTDYTYAAVLAVKSQR
jgi:hypothetical protein